MNDFPFKEINSYKEVYRVFDSNIDQEELVWHFDLEDRQIEVVESGGWLYQEDESIPRKLVDGENFLIKKNLWHRVHKGPGRLVVRITFL